MCHLTLRKLVINENFWHKIHSVTLTMLFYFLIYLFDLFIYLGLILDDLADALVHRQGLLLAFCITAAAVV